MMVLIHKLYNSIGWATEWGIYESAKTNQDSEILANQNWSHQLLSIFSTSALGVEEMSDAGDLV